MQLADNKQIRNRVERSESDLVIDHVLNNCAYLRLTFLKLEFMAVMKTLEWSSLLLISKIAVPLESGDPRGPAPSERQEWNQAEGSENL